MTLRYARHHDLRLTALEGEGVVLHLGTRRYFTVSETGMVILERITEPADLEAIVEALTLAYDVTTDDARASARSFLDTGRRHGLITAEDRP